MKITKRHVIIYLCANLLFLVLMLSYIILILEGITRNSAIAGFVSGTIAGGDLICFLYFFHSEIGSESGKVEELK